MDEHLSGRVRGVKMTSRAPLSLAQDSAPVATPRVAAWARLKNAWPWLLLLAWAPILALSNSRWLYNGLWYDPFIYLGGYLRLPAQLRAWGNLYYYSRLAFLLPGYVAYHFLPPPAANAALDFGHWYISVFALFSLLHRRVGLRGALFTALLVGGYSHFLIAMGWDYPDGAAAMFLLLALWAFSRAPASARPWAWLLAAGLALGAGLHTHFFTATFWPAVGLYLLLTWPGAWSVRRLFEVGFWVLLGLLAVTVLLGVASLALGGNFLFFLSTLNFLHGGANQPGVVFMQPSLLDTFVYAPWLMAPTAVALAAGVSLIYARHHWRAWHNSPARVFSLVYLVAVALLLAVGVRGSTTILNREYYATYLMPFMALAVGGLLAGALDRLSQWQWMTLVVLLVLAVPIAIRVSAVLNVGSLGVVMQYGGWITLAVLLAAMLFVILRRYDHSGLSALTVLIALINPIGPSSPNNLAVDNGKQLNDAFVIVMRSLASVDARWDQSTWLVFNEQHDYVQSMVACAISVCHQNVVSRDYPELKIQYTSQSAMPDFQPGRQIILMGSEPGDLLQAIQASGEAVTAPVLDTVQTITVDGATSYLSYYRVPIDNWSMDLLPGKSMAYQPGVAQPMAEDESLATLPNLRKQGLLAFTGQFDLPAGRYNAQFTIDAQGPRTDDEAAQLEVFSAADVTRLDDKLDLRGVDFAPDGSSSDFQIPFTVGTNGDSVAMHIFSFARLALRFRRFRMERLGP